MSLRSHKVLSIGECMIELSREDDGRFSLAFGGDTFNTAVYLARLGANVSYLTALGSDPYSSQLMSLARSEGIGTDDIQIADGRSAGLYLIETNNGERSFWYWRDSSPARDVFREDNVKDALAAVAKADVIYLSGITLSLYQSECLDRLAEALGEARARDAMIVMDSNYRPRGWPGEKSHTQSVFQRFWSFASIALPTFDDEQDLWDDASAHDTVQRLQALGVPEICVKLGRDGAHVAAGGTQDHITTNMIASPVDTTAAGDSFNAAYLAARLNDRNPAEAVSIANRLAGIVVSHRGAIAPKSATDKVSV